MSQINGTISDLSDDTDAHEYTCINSEKRSLKLNDKVVSPTRFRSDVRQSFTKEWSARQISGAKNRSTGFISVLYSGCYRLNMAVIGYSVYGCNMAVIGYTVWTLIWDVDGQKHPHTNTLQNFLKNVLLPSADPDKKEVNPLPDIRHTVTSFR